MARRSPGNARYQKYTGPEGKTRKSAAAAKPKKASSSKAASGKPTGTKPARSSALAMRNPTTPEFNAIRRQWWIALAAGVVLTLVSWALQKWVTAPWSRGAQASILGMAYVAIGYAFYLDWKKMRPMRKAEYELQRSGKKPSDRKDA